MAEKGIWKLVDRMLPESRGERYGILALLPLLGVAAIFIHGANRARPDSGLQQTADRIIAAEDSKAGQDAREGLFCFDPNTATLEELCALGFELRVAASIVKYRSAGKRFTVPEDLAMCYGVTLEKYREVEPYISIGEEFRRGGYSHAAPVGRNKDGTGIASGTPRAVIRPPSGPFDPNLMDEAGFVALGFTPAQARTIINYRTSLGGFVSAGQFSRCYAVSEEAYAVLEPYILFGVAGSGEPYTEKPAGELVPEAAPEAVPETVPVRIPVEINRADSAALRSVRGIGEVLVVRILEYRNRLGGFASVTQLAEIQGMTEDNYERIAAQITVDSCIISKIDINFAAHKELARRLEEHPYVDVGTARKILSARQLKGGWRNPGELIEDKIWDERTAVRMAPYIVFRPLNDQE
ncbi:MAG: helix-hairpin-helix domain-containing protein [Alistipes sp.]|nr:helix-hairpin-helix domain-containing protein [Alistipes sp.]